MQSNREIGFGAENCERKTRSIENQFVIVYLVNKRSLFFLPSTIRLLAGFNFSMLPRLIHFLMGLYNVNAYVM